jgi:undecaprenyl-diphosphatase
MGAVTAHDLLKHYNEFQTNDLLMLAIGFVVAFVSAFATMKLFLAFLERFSFVGFGWYRIFFGVILLTFFN